ncbi:MAG: hypothetical protein ACW98K_02410 [Candidatus Kariarchaeaceae archaeon]|jgi:hypothetical protein
MQVIDKNKLSELMIDINSFYQTFGDELDACHPEAFDLIHNLISKNLEYGEVEEQIADFNF